VAKLPAEMREPARAARGTSPAKQTPAQKNLLKEHPSLNVTAGSLYLYDQKAADDLKGYADRAAAVRATKPREDFVPALTEVPGVVPATYLFARGDHEQPKDAVPPGGLTVLEVGPVSHHDYHATLLHLFGLDPQRLVYRHNGREQSLLDGQPGRVVREILKA
jgi:hypothetical protein